MSQQHCENEPGYWLIELESTAVLLADPAYHGFASTFFRWIAQEVSDQLNLTSHGIHLDVIEANYHGSYPCLAAQHSRGTIPQHMATEIESAIQHVIQKTTLEAFFEGMSSQQIPTKP